MKSLTILIADDHNIIHLGLASVINKISPEAKVRHAIDFPSVLDLVREHPFDLIIMDVNMPSGNFQSTLSHVKQIQPQVKVLAFSSADESLFAPRFIKQGADGYLNKLSSESELKIAIESMLNSGTYFSPKVKDILIQDSISAGNSYKNPLDVLTDRELEIATLLINGDSLKTIHEKLFIHVSTISTHKTRIFKKLSISKLPELIDIFRLYNS
ncbi:response regulator [Chryseobacterium sp. A301]